MSEQDPISALRGAGPSGQANEDFAPSRRLDQEDRDALVEQGLSLHRSGQLEDAVARFEAARKVAPNDEMVLTNLGVALADRGRNHEAVTVFRDALRRNPHNPYVWHQLRRLVSVIVPFWHVRMLNDTERNDAFERAIQAAIAREGGLARILDIGTGSGLLSMMAARAGARNIVACEQVPIIAEAAQRVIRLNRFEGQIRVVNKASRELAVGSDLDGPADILISEIISSDLLAENVLGTFEDAHERLLRPGATIIPRAATAVGCLVASESLGKYAFVKNVSGFDVSPLTALAPSRLPIHGIMTSWRRLSDDFDLVGIDLTAPKHKPTMHRLAVDVREDGDAVGVVQWIRLDLADGITFSNHPDTYFDGGWLQVLHTFTRPVRVTRGEQLELTVGHDRVSLAILPARSASSA